METGKNKSYIATLALSVFCLIAIVGAATYAYFVPRIAGEGTDMNVSSGKIELKISESKIIGEDVKPILDSTKDTKAQINEFTISQAQNSTLNVCYSLYLAVEELGVNLKNQYFKFELVDSSNNVVSSGDFSEVVIPETGNAKIKIASNKTLMSQDSGNKYILRLWFSYDPVEDQTAYLTGGAETRSFKAHLVSEGVSGACK